MDSDQYRQLDRLLQSVLDRPREEREAFLQHACAGNESLERHVRALLTLEADAKNLLDEPAIEVAFALSDERSDPAKENPDPLIGRTLAHYRIIEKLGGGGMGVVYKAEDTRLHRSVALKLLTDDMAHDSASLGRFRREARIASGLNHPNICTIYDIGEQEGRAFIAMEHLQGTTLKESIAEASSLDINTVLILGIEIADGLDAAHSAGIVHRDVKPANVFITPRGHAKILDFGLAKAQSAMVIDAESPTLSSFATLDGMVLGTAAYMAPEQAHGDAVDHRVDIWALGLVLYEMATGTRPIAAVRLPIEKAPELEQIVSKCLEIDRERRYQHASEIRSDLERLKAQIDSAGERVSVEPKLGSRAASRWKILVPSIVAVTALSVIGYVYAHRAPALTDKDTIVLADFDNKTGDPVFDDTLRQGLAVELQQSPFLSLIPDARVRNTLALMGQPKDARLTPDVARQICERTASAAVLEGSIASVGSQYVLGLRATACQTGSVLDQEQIQAARREDVLNSLSQIATRFRTRVGESLSTVEKYSVPLPSATTSSIEALKVYSTGLKESLTSGKSPMPAFQHALEIDPTFAMAYAFLALGHSGNGESVLAAENAMKAWQLRDRVSDSEKFFIDFNYEREVTGNLEKAYQTLELWDQTYPRREENPNARGLLGGLSTHGTGRFERAIESIQERIAAEPNIVVGYGNLAQSYFVIDRFPEAERTLQRASERKLQNPPILLMRYTIAALKGDKDEMDRAEALAKGRQETEQRLAHAKALALARSGRLQAARVSSDQAADLALQEGKREQAASYRTARAVWEAVCGNAAEGRRDAMASLELSRGRDVEYAAALALALSGDSSRSQPLADDLEKRFPEDTFVKFTYVPVLRALSALEHGKPADSVEQLRAALRYELAVNGLNFNHYYLGGLHSAYVRGEALMAAHQYAEAVAEFQKLLDHRGLVGLDPTGAVARVQLGRAFALLGDSAKAKAAYQDFLTLWKDADPDLPILKQAKAEYARLP